MCDTHAVNPEERWLAEAPPNARSLASSSLSLTRAVPDIGSFWDFLSILEEGAAALKSYAQVARQQPVLSEAESEFVLDCVSSIMNSVSARLAEIRSSGTFSDTAKRDTAIEIRNRFIALSSASCDVTLATSVHSFLQATFLAFILSELPLSAAARNELLVVFASSERTNPRMFRLLSHADIERLASLSPAEAFLGRDRTPIRGASEGRQVIFIDLRRAMISKDLEFVSGLLAYALADSADYLEKAADAVDDALWFLEGTERLPLLERDLRSLDDAINMTSLVEGLLSLQPMTVRVIGDARIVVESATAPRNAQIIIAFPSTPQAFCASMRVSSINEYVRDPLRFAVAHREEWATSIEAKRLRRLARYVADQQELSAFRQVIVQASDRPLIKSALAGIATYVLSSAVGIPDAATAATVGALAQYVAEFLAPSH